MKKNNWAEKEFGNVDFGDKRLNKRLYKISEDFFKLPESTINQSCDNWAETKAAYRFFQNKKVSADEITSSHALETKNRCTEYKSVLVIQDTTYLIYGHHSKTEGLCSFSQKAKNKRGTSGDGLVMHTAFSVTQEGLALGIVGQKIYSRKEVSEKIKMAGKKQVSIDKKDSYRWLELLKTTAETFKGTDTVPITICDRESDIFDFFHLADELKTKVVVRSSHNRKINKKSPYSEKSGELLKAFIKKQEPLGNVEITIPEQKDQKERTVPCEIKIGQFELTPPSNHYKTNKMNKITLSVVHLEEEKKNNVTSPITWSILTNLSVDTLEKAVKIIKYYCLRWRIEVFHKVLKSGLNVEESRLKTANRLINYLSVMSVVAWRIYWLTLLGRYLPDVSCEIFLNKFEWKILYSVVKKKKDISSTPLTIKECVRMISMLGGFLARKNDNDPGIIYLWRGLKKFSNILEGAVIARNIYG
jgi:hypothetical protein